MAHQPDLAAAARPGAALRPLSANSFALQGGLEVVVVERPDQLWPALRRLRQAATSAARTLVYMTDPPQTSTITSVAIDLEWRPDFRPGSNNPVALIQLAAGALCVLVRTCLVGFPPTLQDFLSDSSLTFVGLNWAHADERKMASSFGWATHQFGRFEDLGRLAASRLAHLGVGPRPGLAALATQVLGVVPPKSRQVTLSDWAAPSLDADQVRYAALDALLVWHIYRRLDD